MPPAISRARRSRCSGATGCEPPRADSASADPRGVEMMLRARSIIRGDDGLLACRNVLLAREAKFAVSARGCEVRGWIAIARCRQETQGEIFALPVLFGGDVAGGADAVFAEAAQGKDGSDL